MFHVTVYRKDILWNIKFREKNSQIQDLWKTFDELVKRMNENDIEDKDTARARAAARQKQFNDMESRLQRMDANLSQVLKNN